MRENLIKDIANGTHPEVQMHLIWRLKITQWGYLFFFSATLITNIILSVYADPNDPDNPEANTYGWDKQENQGNYTISRSMTGLYSKSVATFLIPFCNLYLFAIAQFQFSSVRILFRNLFDTGTSSLQEAKLICRINSLAYGIIIWGSIFLQGLACFDAQRFSKIHYTCASLFFLCCLFYVVLMMRIQKTLYGHNLGKHPRFLYTMVGLMCFFFTIFIGGSIFEYHQHQKWSMIVSAIGEYGYVFSCITAITSRQFQRREFYGMYDFAELQSVRIFSIKNTLQTCVFAENWKLIFGIENENE